MVVDIKLWATRHQPSLASPGRARCPGRARWWSKYHLCIPDTKPRRCYGCAGGWPRPPHRLGPPGNQGTQGGTTRVRGSSPLLQTPWPRTAEEQSLQHDVQQGFELKITGSVSTQGSLTVARWRRGELPRQPE